MSFEPENDLERSLISASGNPGFAPQFYRDFSAADLYIIQHGEPPPSAPGPKTIREGEALRIRTIEHKGTPHIPVFSSLTRLQAALSAEAAYIRIKATDLLAATKGSPLLLNPGSDYGKEITACEAASIADGSIWKPGETVVAQKNTEVMIGPPANYPAELAEALRQFFGHRKDVKRAWLAHFFNPATDTKSHTLIAIETSGNFAELSAQIGMVAQNMSIPDPPLDVAQITGSGEGLEGYFLTQSKPFYQRRLLGLF